jgi:hypothetical protein
MDDILANVGKKPLAGWCYGVWTGAIEGSEKIEGIDGNIIYKVKLDDEKKAMLMKGLKRFHHILKLLSVDIEIHGDGPKNRGGDYMAVKLTNRNDRMRIFACAFKNQDLLDHVIVHETGHGIWRHLVDHEWQARLIKLYTDYIQIKETDIDRIRQVAAEFDAFDGVISAFQRMMKKEDRPVFSKMLVWIKTVHKLGREEIEKLHKGGLKTINYFPDHKIVLSKVLPVVTQYGTKNIEEFFCESWTHYWMDKSMPEPVHEFIHQVAKEVGL